MFIIIGIGKSIFSLNLLCADEVRGDMNKNQKIKFFSCLINSLKNSQEDGYSLIEILAVLVMVGIMAAMVGPTLNMGDSSTSSGDSYNLAKSLVTVTRQRAISKTSAARLSFDSSAERFVIEMANTRGCEALTRLSEDADSAASEIKVYSTGGFGGGDDLKIGGDATDNKILGISDKTTITLGVPLGSSQAKDSVVELNTNWVEDSSLNVKKSIGNNKYFYEYLQLPENVTVSSNVNNWTLCFSSRGIASIYDTSGAPQPKLELTFKDKSNHQETLTILKGGAIETN